ncbi:cytochrome P450 [Amycolatopsis coloradensis]|uniref:Cytochrome P450 n=1 Tax=Amycolatopsis coloradensis TaxID=76021 RepID=A0A1R0KTG5_9PSEU|nr:cytochrome P450 [Amycolatopsis coloradensis]OLZ51347.1 cytochrome P450 [Amycolatopsis coloradensis]
MATALPHPPRRIPLIGDVLGVSPKTPVQDSMRHAAELGPVFERKVFGREIVFVHGAEMVADLSDEKRFAKHITPAIANLRPLGGDGLFTAHNEEPNWRRAHEILAPAFSRNAMQAYHPTMLAITRELLDAWDRGGEVDVADDMTKLTLETIGRTGFGYSFSSFERAEPHPFVAAMVRTLRHAQRMVLQPPVIGPFLNRKANRRNEADLAFLHSVVDEVVEARRGDTSTGDLLGLMLNTTQPSTGEALDEVNIRNQIITFLVAGHETTSGALSFALYYLARNPDVLARAQSEVDKVWDGNPDPSYEEVAKLRYVRRVLDEALRLWPTAPAFARQAQVDTVVGGKYPMRKGQWALVLIPALHRDPVWGDDPEAFDPDRFAPDRNRARPAHVYKPFGTGERACIGRQFALHEATLVLGMLLSRYDLRGDSSYRLKVQELLTLKPEGFTLEVSLRDRATVAV